MYPHNSERTNLSAEVPPFVPRKEWDDEKWSHYQPSPLPRYVTTCYPFVQEQHDRRHLMSQQLQSMNLAERWMGQSAPQPQQFIRIGLSGSGSTSARITEINESDFQGNVADSSNFNAVSSSSVYDHDSNSQAHHQFNSSRNKGREKKNVKKGTKRNVGTQKEVHVPEHVGDGPSVMVDKCQQTDFPISIACKSLTDRPSPLKKLNNNHRSRDVQIVDENLDSCSDNNEADVDSDSGYYSPKRRMGRKKNGGTSTSGLLESWQSPHTGNKQFQPVMLIPPNVPPALYYRMHSSPSPLPNALTSHITPPPPGHVLGFASSGPPLIVTPPDPMINSLSLANRPPPGFPIPPSMMDPHASFQLPQRLLWNGAHVIPPNYAQQMASSPQNQQSPTRTINNARLNIASHNKKKGNYSGNFNSSRAPRDQSFNKKTTDQRKGNDIRELMNNPSSVGQSYNRVTPVQSAATANPFYLENTQDFPGLGGVTFIQSSNIGSKLSYSQALLQPPAERNQPVVESSKQPNNHKGSKTPNDAAGHEKAQKSRKRWKKAERASKAADEEYAGISEEQENIKKVLRKSAKSRNKSKAPMLNLGEIFSKLEVQNSPSNSSHGGKKVVQIGGGVAREASTGKMAPPSHRSKAAVASPANALDSTAPSMKRGKERENPKPKKPSALKKVILKEREEKKEQRLQQLSTMTSPDHDVPPYPTDILKTLPVHAPDSNDESPTKLEQLSTEDISLTVPQIHSRRYREYCCQVLDKKIDDTCTIILQKLVQFQDRLYQKDPVKAKMRRRLVMGLREVTKHLKLKKLKCVIISPNLEKIQAKGGLDDTLQNILDICEEQNVLYIFALGRKAMGRAVAKLVPVSIVGIFDYSGVEDYYKQLVELVEDAQNKYKDMISVYQNELVEANVPPVQPSAPTSSKRFAHMTHSRNPSAASCISFASFISEPISEMNEGSNWRVMMDAGEESTLSPPPEADGSTDEDPENSILAEAEKENAVTKNFGNTSADDQLTKDVGKISIVEEENVSSFEKETSSVSSESKDALNPAQKCLEQSFSSTCSTLVPSAIKLDSSQHQLSELPSPVEEKDPGSLIEAIENSNSSSAVQDRIHLWLKDTQQSVQDLEVDEEDVEDLAFSSPETFNENSTGESFSGEDKSES